MQPNINSDKKFGPTSRITKNQNKENEIYSAIKFVSEAVLFSDI